MNSSLMQLVFSYEGETKKQSIVQPIFKNPNMLAFQIPDMGEEVPIGQHQLNVEITFNG